MRGVRLRSYTPLPLVPSRKITLERFLSRSRRVLDYHPVYICMRSKRRCGIPKNGPSVHAPRFDFCYFVAEIPVCRAIHPIHLSVCTNRRNIIVTFLFNNPIESMYVVSLSNS